MLTLFPVSWILVLILQENTCTPSSGVFFVHQFKVDYNWKLYQILSCIQAVCKCEVAFFQGTRPSKIPVYKHLRPLPWWLNMEQHCSATGLYTISKYVNRHEYNYRQKSLLHSQVTTALNASTIRAGIELGSACWLRRVEISNMLQLYANQASLATRFNSGAYISYRGNVIFGGTQFLTSAVASNAKWKLDEIAAGHITQK